MNISTVCICLSCLICIQIKRFFNTSYFQIITEEENEVHDELNDSLIFVDEYIDLEEPKCVQGENQQNVQDVKPVVPSGIAPVPTAIMIKSEELSSTHNNTVDNSGVQDVKPIIPTGIAKVPAAIMVKEEDTSNIADGSAIDESSVGSYDGDASAESTLSDLFSPEDRTEDLKRLYGRQTPSNEPTVSSNNAVKRLDFN